MDVEVPQAGAEGELHPETGEVRGEVVGGPAASVRTSTGTRPCSSRWHNGRGICASAASSTTTWSAKTSSASRLRNSPVRPIRLTTKRRPDLLHP